MKIGILGGSFDPPHQGHIHISQLALQKLRLDQIWWIPTAQNPLKKKSAASYQARLSKAQSFIKNNPRIRIKDFEKHSYFAYDLVKKLRAQYPRDQFVWVMGDDNLREFHKWKRVDDLVRMIDFAVFARLGIFSSASFSSPLVSFPRRRESSYKISMLYNWIPAYAGMTQEDNLGMTRRPRFYFFNTKKYDLSSTALRQHN